MTSRDLTRIYVDGTWSASSSSETIAVVNPATEQHIADVAAGSADDVARAVDSAKRALPNWSKTSGAERASWLRQIRKGIEARFDVMATDAMADIGMPIDLAGPVQVGLPLVTLDAFADLAESYSFRGEDIGLSRVFKEPCGVVACITPWNFPLHQIALKIGGALAAGCTVVLKPSEVAPLLAYHLADIVHEIGLPAGVFNLVSGHGSVVGEALATHQDVAMISFTGSTIAGKRVAELASSRLARVALECGGKSANLLLSDAPFEKAVANAVAKCFLNSGQTCAAMTRLLVPADRLDQVKELVREAVKPFAPIDPARSGFGLGPVVSRVQQERVLRYIELGLADGAELLAGGSEGVPSNGFYVSPTVFVGVTPDMTIAREEIFGPVLSILTYESEDEAVELANSLSYGLSAGVWSGSIERSLEVAARLQAGQVEVNGADFNPLAPFGGYKESGIGREGGTYGLEEFLEVKSVQIPG